jgi:hypothetical protein
VLSINVRHTKVELLGVRTNRGLPPCCTCSPNSFNMFGIVTNTQNKCLVDQATFCFVNWMVPVTIRAQYQAQQAALIGLACTEYNNFLGYVLMPTWSSTRGQLWLSETACMKALAGQNVNLDRDRTQFRKAMHYLTIIKFEERKSAGTCWRVLSCLLVVLVPVSAHQDVSHNRYNSQCILAYIARGWARGRQPYSRCSQMFKVVGGYI